MSGRKTFAAEDAGGGTTRSTESALAFAVDERGAPRGLEVHVNFGLHTGREVSAAEIDRLAALLLERVERVTIVSEVRHEIDAHSEASVHLVRIALEPPEPGRSSELESWLVACAAAWARRCGAERAADGALLDEP